MSHQNGLQPQLIRYDASVQADAPNQSLTLSVNGRSIPFIVFCPQMGWCPRKTSFTVYQKYNSTCTFVDLWLDSLYSYKSLGTII